jgi:hypothetical protein
MPVILLTGRAFARVTYRAQQQLFWEVELVPAQLRRQLPAVDCPAKNKLLLELLSTHSIETNL